MTKNNNNKVNFSSIRVFILVGCFRIMKSDLGRTTIHITLAIFQMVIIIEMIIKQQIEKIEKELYKFAHIFLFQFM